MSVKLYAPAGDELRDAVLCADFEAAEKAGRCAWGASPSITARA